MNERPILFNTAMVRAILAGRKTQSRRPMFANRPIPSIACPGDTLWVRETWAPGIEPGTYRYRADGDLLPPGEKWRPSIHMPRVACRLTLRVTRTWIERLVDISWRDVLAEGIGDTWDRRKIGAFQAATSEMQDELRASFRSLWVSLYGEDPGTGWNPETRVCAFAFERLGGQP